ncbi:MAG: ABC transporter ATP-binding protein, partial [Thermoprotei archaeon]
KSVPSITAKGVQPPTGEVTSLINLPTGCRYHPRCPFVMDRCKREEPSLIDVNSVKAACWLYG